jgi:hypothetical protein
LDLSNDVFDYISNKIFEQTKEEGYDAAYVMEIDGSKVLHVINPGKLTLLDEKLPELRNKKEQPVVEQTTPDTKAQPSEVAPSVSLTDTQKEKISKLKEERDSKLLLEPQGIRQENLIKTPSYINNRKVEAEYNEKINQIINEATPPTDSPADGNLPIGNNLNSPQGENKGLQPTAKPKTNKGEVGAKLIEVNKIVFGLDDKKSKTNAVVMEKTIENMAERAGISKEEMFDKIDFEKGDAKTAENLSKKGKALFQIIGKNANLSKDVKQFLNDAKALEKKRTDAKTIFMQTGWEKGADRVEI